MSGESAEANTCVFWDVDDCPIPNYLDPNSIYKNIKSALKNNGYDGNLEIKLYGDKKTFSDDLMLDTGMTFVPKAPEGRLARVMLFDIVVWAMDHRPADLDNRQSYLMVISQDVTEDAMLVDSLNCMYERAYDVLLAQSDKLPSRVLPFTVRSVWLWTSLLDGGNPIDQSGDKRKSIADTVADSEDNPCSI